MMAESSNLKLYRELKHRFPEVPDAVVTNLMKQNNNVRDQCFIALGRESQKYVIDEHLSNQVNSIHLNVPDSRPRSSSSCSQSSIGNGVSGLTPPKSFTHSISAPHIGSQQQQQFGHLLPGQEPQTAPVITGNFGPFLTHSLSGGEFSFSSPGVPCSQFIPSSNRDGEGAALQQIHQQQPQLFYQMPHSQFAEHAVAGHSTPTGSSASHHFASIGSYHHQPFSSAGASGQHFSSPPSSSGPAVSSSAGAGQFQSPIPYYQQRIIVQNDPASRPSQFVQEFPTPQPGNRQDSPSSYLGSPQRSTPSSHNQTPQHSQFDLRAGISLRPHQTVDQVNLGITNKKTSLTSQSPTPPSSTSSPNYQTRMVIHLNPNSSTNTNLPSPGHALQTVSGMPVGYYSSNYGDNVRKFSLQDGRTPTSAHPESSFSGQLFLRSSSQNDPRNVNIKPDVMNVHDPGVLKVLQQPILPILSPVSSAGNLSGLDAPAETGVPVELQGRTSRSGSLVGATEDMAYVQALILHQRARMEKLVHDLEQQTKSYSSLKSEVSSLENDIAGRRKTQGTRFPTASDNQKLRDENRRMRVEIQLITGELDKINNGEMLLGVLDPTEQQSFYSNIDTGQQVPVHGQLQHPGQRQTTNRFTHTSSTAPHLTRPPPPPLPIRPPVGAWPQGVRYIYHIRNQVMPPVRPSYPPPPVPSPRLPPPPRDNRLEASRPPTRPPPPPPEDDADHGVQWNCSACTFLNHPTMNNCEICEMPRISPGFR